MGLLYNNSPFYEHFFVFIKNGHEMTDEQLLKSLDLEDYQLLSHKDGLAGILSERNHGKEYLYLTEDRTWTHLIDDLYSLWHDKHIRGRIEELSSVFDIFYCSIGDVDELLDFVYYKDGELRRKYVEGESKSKGVEMVVDIGKPLIGEEEALEKVQSEDKLLRIVQNLGIDMRHDASKIRCYVRDARDAPYFSDSDEY